MSQQTEPLFKFILFFCLIGLALVIWGLAAYRDLVTFSGTVLIATCIHAIARLVK